MCAFILVPRECFSRSPLFAGTQCRAVTLEEPSQDGFPPKHSCKGLIHTGTQNSHSGPQPGRVGISVFVLDMQGCVDPYTFSIRSSWCGQLISGCVDIFPRRFVSLFRLLVFIYICLDQKACASTLQNSDQTVGI